MEPLVYPLALALKSTGHWVSQNSWHLEFKKGGRERVFSTALVPSNLQVSTLATMEAFPPLQMALLIMPQGWFCGKGYGNTQPIEI